MDPVLKSHHEYIAKRFDLSCGQMCGLEPLTLALKGNALLFEIQEKLPFVQRTSIFAPLKSTEQEFMLHMQS